MMKGCARRFAARQGHTASEVKSSRADIVVVGGGLTGCLIGARLASENLNVVILEEGANILRAPKWHRQVGCAMYAHRVAKRGYESLIATVPQRPWIPVASSSDYTSSTAASNRTSVVHMPIPKVLGGSGVVGSRSWFFGSADDWKGTPLNFREDLLPRIQKLESVEKIQAHRGKYGRFAVSKGRAVSPLYRPFTEAMNKEVSLSSNLNPMSGVVLPSCGRPDVFIDPTTQVAHQTLDTFVAQAIQLKRPLEVRCGAKVVGITGNKQRTATGVTVVNSDGSTEHLAASVVVLAGGAVGSAQLLTASEKEFGGSIGAAAQPASFWDAPSVVLQYKTRADVLTHNAYMDPIVQQWLGLLLTLGVEVPPAVSSSYDDIIALWSSSGSQTPDIKILMQPFTLDVFGNPSSPSQSSSGGSAIEHGFQLVVMLARPASRGTVSAATGVDPNYFSAEEDRAALQKGVAMVRAAVRGTPSLARLIANDRAEPFAEFFESRGVCGGSLPLGAAVDGASFVVRGTDNVYCSDSSILPNPLIGDRTPPLLAIADKFVDKYLNKADVVARVDAGAPLASNEARIIY